MAQQFPKVLGQKSSWWWLGGNRRYQDQEKESLKIGRWEKEKRGSGSGNLKSLRSSF